MKPKRLLRRGVCAQRASNTSLAFAQSSAVNNSTLLAPDEDAQTGVLRSVVVVGVRASLASAQEIKRDKLEIVDSIVAANFMQDLSTDVPNSSITGTNLLDPTHLPYTGIACRSRRFEGDQVTVHAIDFFINQNCRDSYGRPA